MFCVKHQRSESLCSIVSFEEVRFYGTVPHEGHFIYMLHYANPGPPITLPVRLHTDKVPSIPHIARDRPEMYLSMLTADQTSPVCPEIRKHRKRPRVL